MGEERLTRAESIFQAAADLRPEERAAFLSKHCGDDAELRTLVERLLARDDAGLGSFLEPDASPTRMKSEHESAPRTPDRIGPYRILEKLGEGGFGEVFAAEQSEPVKRRVALKVLKAGMDTREVLARFEAERQALAMMNHPNIARVLDAGETPLGRPYFIMDLIQGEPITAYCDHHRLTMKERLDLFLPVCHAIQHAHQKGVIHRDVKPSNVLVTIVDGRPVPRAIDFGIAKATAASLTEKTLYTMRGQMIGTPAYMSPEQAEMSGLDVDTRTDVYSLGVLLYELLTGRLPFETKALQEAGLDAMRRIIRDEEPLKPSTRVSTLGEEAREAAARRQTDPAHWRKALRRELDWIVMKALEKDRNRRYETVSGMAADVGRYLADQPVLAGPPSTAYRMQKYVKRNRVGVGFASVIGLGLVLAFALVAVQNTRITAARDEAEAVTVTLEEMLASVDPTKSGRDVTVREMLDQTATTLGEKFEGQPLIEARLRNTVGKTYFALGEYDEAEEHLRRAAEIRSERLGEEDPWTLECRKDLAHVMSAQGRYDEAGTLARETLEIGRRVLGEEHPQTLILMSELAVEVAAQGRSTAEAEAVCRKALETQRRVLGEEHRDTLLTMFRLAGMYASQGRHDEAEVLQRETLEIQRRLLGEEHPDALTSMNNLAASCRNLGRYEEAEALYRKALEIQRRVLGEEHPDALRTMSNLAISCRNLGRHEEAEALFRKTLEIQRRVLGEEHPDALLTMIALAVSRRNLGHDEEADSLCREVVETQRRGLGEGHPDALERMGDLCALCWNLGRYEEAEVLNREVLEAERRVLGEEHPFVLDRMMALANAIAYQGRLDESEELDRTTLGICRHALGEGHRRTNRIRYNLACRLAMQDRRSEAIAFLQDALDNGYRLQDLNRVLILDDPELASLHGDPEFEAIVEELKRRNQESGAVQPAE